MKTFLLALLLLLPASAWGGDLLSLRAQAVRAAVDSVADSVVVVELVGVAAGAGGELSEDAPTVALAIDNQRHFLASSLVVRGEATSILLVNGAGQRSVASVVARDHARQLVLLRAEEDLGIPPLELSDVDVAVGQTVIALGRHPGGETPSVSTGILSGTGRNWGLALQTDARVSSAFYGGPLLDLRGRVLGIIVPMVPEGGAEDETGWYDSGIAFAIPTASILQRLPRLIDGEEIHQGLVGIVAKDRDPYVESTEIAAVRPRSPAARAELRPGDRVEAVDGVAVRSHREIKQLLGGRDAGESVSVRLRRDDEALEKTIRLAESIPPLTPQQLGITVAAVIAQRQREDDNQPDRAALMVSGVVSGSPADGELKIGDRLEAINGNEVEEVAAVRRQIFAADPNEPLMIRLRRGEQSLEVSLSTETLAKIEPDALPAALRGAGEQAGDWKVGDFEMPDLPNDVNMIAPESEPAEADRQGENAASLGLLVLLADPGPSELQTELQDWVAAARSAGVIVVLVAPAQADRWTPDEIDVAARIAAAVRQQHRIDVSRQAIAGLGKGAGGSMALATALMRPGTFSGLRVRFDTRPPGVRLRENDPAAPLQLWLSGQQDQQRPPWADSLEKLGYPVLAGGSDPAELLAWVQSLTVI